MAVARGRRWRRALLVPGALLVALLLAEGIVRVAGLAPSVYRLRPGARESALRLSDNPILGYELKPDWRDDHPDLHGSFPRTNSLGQRDVERTLAKPAGVRRILLLGDSVVAGHGIRDLNDTISRRLEELVAAQGIEVLNFGVGGYCTAAEVELLAVKGLRYSPDLVILVFTENDYLDRNEQIVDLPPERPRLAESLFVRSHLFRLLALATNLWGFREATDPGLYVRRNEAAVGGQNVRTSLPRLRALSEEHGFRTLIVLWPAFTALGIEDRHWVRDVAPDTMMVEVFAAQSGLRTLRLSPFFRQEWRQHRPDEPESAARDVYTIGDGMHPSEAGAKVAADALAAMLRANPELLPGK